MIIISQYKNRIINFDNLTQVYITQEEEKTAYFIRFETVDSLYDDLGEYKIEERAKEVLQEIITSYRNYRTAECAGYTNVLQKTAVYEMPEK